MPLSLLRSQTACRAHLRTSFDALAPAFTSNKAVAIPRARTLATMASSSSVPAGSSSVDWKRLVRFVAKEDGKTYLGEPQDAAVDLGKATRAGETVKVTTLHAPEGDAEGDVPWNVGKSQRSKEFTVDKLLSPLTKIQVNTIRCIGLNYMDHAAEAKLPLPEHITLFHKPRTALTGPWPASVIVPKCVQDEQSDYESELCIVIGKDCRDVPQESALDYVLGYTAANDISARKAQFETSQWCRSKGFDHACPIGPCIVSASTLPNRNPAASQPPMRVQGRLNGKQLQDGSTADLVFGVAEIVSFLSQGTTLEQGSIILTGTPAGVGTFFKPNIVMKHGDVFEVELGGGIGTLINEIVYE